MADKPFFMYYAPGATHAPHHVPAEWADKYKGHFDAGWDALRDQILARQKQLGIVPESTDLSDRPAEIQAWEDTPDDLKPVLARQMEVYAGFLEHTDYHIGRLVDALDDLDILDNTLIYYIVGDNGASAEGTPNGTFNELLSMNGSAEFESVEFMADRIDDRRVERFNSDLAGRPVLIRGKLSDVVRRYDSAQRELGSESKEQVACGDRRDHRSRGRRVRSNHCPGWRLRRMELLPTRRPPEALSP